MEYLRDRLLRETVRFLELCQEKVSIGMIKLEDYYKFTNFKFSFLDTLVNEEKNMLFMDTEIRIRLNKLYANNYYIYNKENQIVG